MQEVVPQVCCLDSSTMRVAANVLYVVNKLSGLYCPLSCLLLLLVRHDGYMTVCNSPHVCLKVQFATQFTLASF